MAWGWNSFGDYVSADEKRRRADATLRTLEKKGRKLAPVRLSGRAIASSFWGKAWGENLESYSDYASRLPRGRSYLRQGALLDLQAERGVIKALVSGTRLYEIEIKIDTMGKGDWKRLKQDCAGKVGSLMDLLQGKLSAQVMEIVTRKATGLFPGPGQIHLACSCPDWANLCKHVATVLYGVGTRLDERPELLFVLRGVDHLELIAAATQSLQTDLAAPATGRAGTLDESRLAEVFGIEMGEMGSVDASPSRSKPSKTRGRAASKVTKAAAGSSKLPIRLPVRKTPLAKSAATSKKLAWATPQATKKKPASASVSKGSRKRGPAAR